MKKTMGILVLCFCLTACAPASPEPTGEAPMEATVETAPAETETQGETPLVGELRSVRQGGNTGETYYSFQYQLGEIRKLDFAAAREEILYQFGEGYALDGDLIVEADALYGIRKQELFRLPLDGGELTTRTLENLPGSRMPAWCDDRAAYLVEGGIYNQPTENIACRIDLETGEITDLPLPAMALDGVFAADGSRLLVRQCLTSQPLSSVEGEVADALLQSAVSEYDWWDLNTGELEKVLELPYDMEVDAGGNSSYQHFVGKTKDRLYFETIAYNENNEEQPGSIISYRLDGSDKRVDFVLPPGSATGPVYRQGELRWLVNNTGTRMHVYDVATSTDYDVRPQGSEGYPLAFTGDDRVLVITRRGNDGTVSYGLISIDAFLTGSSQWTPVESPDEKTTIPIF